MSRVPLTLIGESINDSVPSTHALFEANDLAAITGLARSQSELGADYIDVNVGPRPADFMAAVVRAVQTVTPKPLSIDSPDYALAAAGLAACDPACGTPILNSISPLRLEMFDLLQSHRFRPILLASENMIDGVESPCRTAEETYDAARLLLETARSHGLSNDDCIIDPGIAPIGADTENNIHRLMGALRLIHDDPAFAGVHMSVGLSNFTVMLPPKRKDGSPVRSALESAFLTKAIPLGLDMIIGSVKRKYELLPPEHPAMQCLEAVLKSDGFEAIMAVRTFYAT